MPEGPPSCGPSVVVAAADGSGPPVGARRGFAGAGGWAQRVAVDADQLALVAEDVDLGAAEVVVGLDGVAPVFGGILDDVGGPLLGAAFALLAAGRRDAQIGWRGSWERVHEAAEALRGRQVAGKAILEVP